MSTSTNKNKYKHKYKYKHKHKHKNKHKHKYKPFTEAFRLFILIMAGRISKQVDMSQFRNIPETLVKFPK